MAKANNSKPAAPAEVSIEVEAPAVPVVTSDVPSVEVSEDTPSVLLVAPPEQEKMTTIKPRKTIVSCRIGGAYYQFIKGTPVKVPSAICAHLEQKGII